MIADFLPSRAEGMTEAPPSKSAAQRIILCAGLADGVSVVRNVDLSEDIRATADCLRALGAEIAVSGETSGKSAPPGERMLLRQTLSIRGTGISRAVSRAGRRADNRAGRVIPAGNVRPLRQLPCRESGTTLRFLIPLCLLGGPRTRFTGSKRLFERPLSVYEDICREQGLYFQKTENSLETEGLLRPGSYEIPGDISSQFISGLLFALPLLSGDSEIRLLPPVESRPYIRLTEQALDLYGLKVEREGNILRIPGGQRYLPREVTVEGDYSNAAFFDAFNLSGGNVRVTGLKEESLQGDRVYKEYFEQLDRGPAVISLSDCPDLGPVLFALAARLHGGCFTGVSRLRLKESDRLAVMAQELRKMGVSMEISGAGREEEIRISPGVRRPEEPLDGHGDHRVVMALSFLLAGTGGSIRGAEAVKKSLPDYFDRLEKLGVQVSLREN